VSATTDTGVAELLDAIDRRRPAAADGRGATDPAPTATIALRPLTPHDDRALFGIFRTSLDDLIRRHGESEGWPFDPADAADWASWRPLYEHIGATADLAWGADAEGRLVGYARSIRRGDDRELTECFVLPVAQGQGVGTRLLERAFPADAHHRSVLASTDAAALSRYLRLGLVPTAPIHRFEGAPAPDPRALPGDVTARPLEAIAHGARLDALAAIDERVLGVRRDVDHEWLGEQRTGWLLERAGAPVGYAYGGTSQGPALGLIETDARHRGEERISVWAPVAGDGELARYLLGRGYRIDPDPLYLLEDSPRIRADRYLVMSPPFHL
jgi:GNAT superfamily N-acetyltransferase